MAKFVYKFNPKVTEIFNELEKFRDFCRNYGYRYNESDLYNFKSYAWQQYSKFTQGKRAKNMWNEDLARFAGG
jgi:hypothetical protein